MNEFYLFVETLAIFVSIFFSAFFSMCETAVISSNHIKIFNLEKKNKNAKIIKSFLNTPEYFITAILIANNVVNILASVLTTHLVVKIFGDIGVAIATGLMTFFLLIIGDIIPKRLGTRHSEKIAIKFAKILNFTIRLLHPFVVFFIFFTDWVVGFFGQKKDNHPLTREEIRTLVNVAEKDGVIKKHEKKLIHKIFELTDMKIKDIMIPKKEICFADYFSSLEGAIQLMIKSGYTRLPVYKNNKIVGMIHARDIFKYSSDLKNITLEKAIRQIMFVDENDKIPEVMKRLQKTGNHMAIVMRKGLVIGLISVEDIFAEIVAKIGK